ncbi:MAG TPA: alpha/beta hydrolase [Acidimicrobiia bacterium]|nr:alpha/beta hydrolase [Acidimicrobiia bacterium]
MKLGKNLVLVSAMSTTTAPDGASIAYEITGDGPPLVLVHGITESRRSWDPLLAPLARDHLVVAVDLRGHGESDRRPPYDVLTMAADTRAVVDAVGATQPLVVGHSLGGAVVSVYAAANPVRGVVNVDQPLELGGFQALLAPVEPMLRGEEASFRSLMRQILDSLYGALPAAERARIEPLTHPEQDVVIGAWDLVLTADPEQLDELTRSITRMITSPYLALHGTDPGETYATWLQSVLPSASLEVWPDLGHYPHLVEPDRFVQRVRDFEAYC